jgi:hypothetical protein
LLRQALGGERRGSPCVARRRGQCLRFSRGVVACEEVVSDVLSQLRPAQRLRILSSQDATGTTPQSLSAMNAMIQLNVVALHHLYAAEQW